jgi:hypothetical protein
MGWDLPLWLTGFSSNPLALFPVLVISVVAMSVLLTILTTITVRPPRYAYVQNQYF